MSDDELRTALRTLAEPAIPPPGARDRILAALDRRRRRRRAAFGLVAVAATVTAVGGVALVGALGENHAPVAADPLPTTAPYEATPCPPRLPDRRELAERLPDLIQVASIRLCTDDRDYVGGAVPARPDELAALPDPEALVFGLDRFAAEVASLPPARLGWCNAAFVVSASTALQLAMADGSTHLVPASLCREVRYGDRRLDSNAIRHAFLAALDAQRSDYSYGRTVDAPLTCRFYGESGPVRPGRERLVEAVRCGHYDEAARDYPLTALSADARRKLQEAWRDASPHESSRWAQGTEVDECVDVGSKAESIVARTDRGDVIRLIDSPCGYLHLDSWQAGTGWEIPLTLDDL